MKEFSYTVKDELGIHARPAGLLVKAAGAYASAIKLTANGRTVDAKRIMGIMSLGVKKDAEVTISAEGEDEDTAIAAMEDFFKENL